MDSKKKLYIIVAVVSLVLYFSGVLSGIYVSRAFRAQTKQDIGVLEDYVNSVRNSVEDIQVQQTFFNVIGENDTCTFFELSMNDMQRKLELFWGSLPYRLEEYKWPEGGEYGKLKRDYTFLSLRAWLIAKKYYSECDSNIIPILYFYSENCEECVKQGEELDKFKESLSSKGKNVVAFTLDINQNEASVGMIARYYKIDSAPALAMPNGVVLQGDVFKSQDILNRLNGSGNDEP